MILMLAVLAQIVSAAPPLPPAEAARVWVAAHPGEDHTGTRPIPRGDGPHVTILRGRPQDGPWDWPAPLPERRLDGRLWTDPELIYGQPWPFLAPGAYPAGVSYPSLPSPLGDGRRALGRGHERNERAGAGRRSTERSGSGWIRRTSISNDASASR